MTYQQESLNTWDHKWQQFFALCGILFAVFCGLGLEVFMPQPPAFNISAAATAQYYATHQMGVMIGMTFCSIAMAFLLAWTIQLGVMLWVCDKKVGT